MELPGPMFTPRPGWGGKLRNSPIAHGILTVVAVLWVGSAIIYARRDTLPATSPSPTPYVASTDYIETVNPGEGVSRLAARALAAFLADRPDWQLTSAQKYRAADHLWRSMSNSHPAVGEQVLFSTVIIESAISGY